jgi:hypothetical protein
MLFSFAFFAASREENLLPNLTSNGEYTPPLDAPRSLTIMSPVSQTEHVGHQDVTTFR